MTQNCCSHIPQRWVTVFMSFFGLFNAYAMRICLSIAITEMAIPTNTSIEFKDSTCSENEYHSDSSKFNETIKSKGIYDWSEYTQGIILSSFYWGYIITNLLGGVIVQKYGGKHTLGVAILSTAIFTLATPFCITWGGSSALICLRILMGLGEGTTYPAMNDLLAQWIPEDERSVAGSIAYSGAPLGTILGMAASGIILQHSDMGWPAVFYFFGAFGIVSFLLNTVLCYSRPIDNPFISGAEKKLLKEKLKSSEVRHPTTPWRQILTSGPVWALVIAVIGNAWGFLTIVSDMPKYMSSVLKFSVEDNGYLSSVPYLSMWLSSCLTSWIADYFIAKKGVSIGTVRKIGSTIASLGPGIFLVAASYAGCNGFLVVSLLSIGLSLMGCATFSVLINALDIGPNYAGTLMGLVNGISTLSGIISPYLVGIITPNQTINEWRLVFWIVFGIFLVTNTIYLICGSGELQEWNDPTLLDEKERTSNDDVEEVIPMLPLNKISASDSKNINSS